MMNNISKAQKLIKENGFDAILVNSEENMHYFCGFSPSEGLILITNDECYHIVDSRYTVIAQRMSKESKLHVIEIETTFIDALSAIIKKHNLKNIAFEDEKTTVASYSRLCTIEDTAFHGIKNKLTMLRSIKSRDELDTMIKAQKIAEKAFDEMLNHVKIGKTEKELAALLDYLMLSFGSEKASFDTIFVSGKNTSMPHGVPSEKKLCDGDFVTVDFGATYNGYHSDMTRTFCIGHATDEMIDVYNTVLTAQKEVLKQIKAGAACSDMHNLTASIINGRGYGGCFKHALGHGLGLEIHEGLSCSPRSEHILQVGDVTSVEPGIYLNEKFGVRIEDVVYIEENGCTNLMKTPKELLIL